MKKIPAVHFQLYFWIALRRLLGAYTKVMRKIYMFIEGNIARRMKHAEVVTVSNLWSQKATPEDWESRKLLSWCLHPYVEKQHINKMISGDADVDWFHYVKNTYVPKKLDYGLDLGCGSGWLEGVCLKNQVCERMDAFDIAAGAIEIAQKNAVAEKLDERINYGVRDINTIRLEQGKYDIIFTPSSAHHFKELEHIFREVHEGLKPSGLFVLVEYVGPSQFQWTEKQLRIINDLLEILPVKYRGNIRIPGLIRERLERHSLEYMNAHDPSEAVRSADIVPLLENYFHILERRDYGGTVLNMLLHDIAGNFNEKTEEDIAFLGLLCYFEKVLLREKVLPSDFSLIIASR
ncbi:MAG: class I SAM-dependent methyltransferase [Syntrophales bacterium]